MPRRGDGPSIRSPLNLYESAVKALRIRLESLYNGNSTFSISIPGQQFLTMANNHYLTLPPSLDELESTATLGQRREALSAREFEILSQLLRYPEEPLSREALKRAAGFDDDSIADRKLDAWLNVLIKKMNVLWPLFPVLRFVAPDSYIYTEKPPKKKPSER